MGGPMGTSQNCRWPSWSSALLHLVIATLLLLPLGTKAWLLSHHNRLLAWWLKPDLGHSSKLDFPGMWPRNLGLASVFDDSYSISLHCSTLSPSSRPLYIVEASPSVLAWGWVCSCRVGFPLLFAPVFMQVFTPASRYRTRLASVDVCHLRGRGRSSWSETVDSLTWRLASLYSS